MTAFGCRFRGFKCGLQGSALTAATCRRERPLLGGQCLKVMDWVAATFSMDELHPRHLPLPDIALVWRYAT